MPSAKSSLSNCHKNGKMSNRPKCCLPIDLQENYLFPFSGLFKLRCQVARPCKSTRGSRGIRHDIYSPLNYMREKSPHQNISFKICQIYSAFRKLLPMMEMIIMIFSKTGVKLVKNSYFILRVQGTPLPLQTDSMTQVFDPFPHFVLL